MEVLQAESHPGEPTVSPNRVRIPAEAIAQITSAKPAIDKYAMTDSLGFQGHNGGMDFPERTDLRRAAPQSDRVVVEIQEC